MTETSEDPAVPDRGSITAVAFTFFAREGAVTSGITLKRGSLLSIGRKLIPLTRIQSNSNPIEGVLCRVETPLIREPIQGLVVIGEEDYYIQGRHAVEAVPFAVIKLVGGFCIKRENVIYQCRSESESLVFLQKGKTLKITRKGEGLQESQSGWLRFCGKDVSTSFSNDGYAVSGTVPPGYTVQEVAALGG